LREPPSATTLECGVILFCLAAQEHLSMIGFILKVLIASALISVAIKYGGGYLPIQGTTSTALIAVLTPSIVMAILFTVRWQRTQDVRK